MDINTHNFYGYSSKKFPKCMSANLMKFTEKQLHKIVFQWGKKKPLAQQSCARKAGFLYLLKQQFSFSLKHKYRW